MHHAVDGMHGASLATITVNLTSSLHGCRVFDLVPGFVMCVLLWTTIMSKPVAWLALLTSSIAGIPLSAWAC